MIKVKGVPNIYTAKAGAKRTFLWTPFEQCFLDFHTIINTFCLNSLAPGKFEWNFRYVIFKQILVIDGWGISCEIALVWMSLDFTADLSPLVQVMAWCLQATSHYVSQCWSRSLSPYGVTRPQWVNQDFSCFQKALTKSVHLTRAFRVISRIILWIRPANERQSYNVTSSLIDWAHSQDDPWSIMRI